VQDRGKKVKSGQDRTVQKKSQGGNISPIWGEAPTVQIETKICMAGNLADVRFHVCKVSRWYFQCLRFYRGSNFPFSYWFFSWALQQCSATALPVIKVWKASETLMLRWQLHGAS